MTRPDRKALIAAYKEQKTVAGVFAVICNSTGEVWVGRSTHVDTERNGLWFALKMGSSPHRALQTVWRENGEAEFRFEVLDRLSADLSAMARETELKERAARWTTRLHATPL
jgi:hypothetical protein